jgi:predicted ABC-type ATPase
MIPQWRTQGYQVRLIFLSLPSREIAIARVATRVAQGGHNVASAVVRRRFEGGLRNFRDVYMRLVDHWWWYDNSGTSLRLISEGGLSR